MSLLQYEDELMMGKLIDYEGELYEIPVKVLAQQSKFPAL